MKPFWIKERHNPQLGTYYVAMGQMANNAAKKYELGTLYGDNIMLRFETEKAYLRELEQLRGLGKRVQ